MNNNRAIGGDAGFNLIELTAVMAIMGIVLVISLASYRLSTDRAASIACLHNRRELIDAAQLYSEDHAADAKAISELLAYVQDSDLVTRCPGDRFVQLAFHSDTQDVTCPIHSD